MSLVATHIFPSPSVVSTTSTLRPSWLYLYSVNRWAVVLSEVSPTTTLVTSPRLSCSYHSLLPGASTAASQPYRYWPPWAEVSASTLPAGVRLRSPRSPRALVVRSARESRQRISQNVKKILVENIVYSINSKYFCPFDIKALFFFCFMIL